jgi:hypothetical protein
LDGAVGIVGEEFFDKIDKIKKMGEGKKSRAGRPCSHPIKHIVKNNFRGSNLCLSQKPSTNGIPRRANVEICGLDGFIGRTSPL